MTVTTTEDPETLHARTRVAGRRRVRLGAAASPRPAGIRQSCGTGEVRAVAGYRVLSMLYCGRVLSVDDVVTAECSRSRGHGTRLLAWLTAEASALQCAELQLISHVTREAARCFCFRAGLGVTAFHFRTVLS